VGAGVLALALAHGRHRDVWVHFFVYAAIVFFFKARDALRRVPQLVAQARTRNGPAQAGPWWLRLPRLLLGYDTWSRTERLGFAAIAVIVCALFGWAKGGPFAAALFLSVAVVNAGLVLVALAARVTARRPT
jgi:hypothetical protein